MGVSHFWEHCAFLARIPLSVLLERLRGGASENAVWLGVDLSCFFAKACFGSKEFVYQHAPTLAAKTLRYLEPFWKAGFCLHLVADAAERHPSKAAALERRAQRQKDRIQLLQVLAELEACSRERRVELQERARKLAKQASSVPSSMLSEFKNLCNRLGDNVSVRFTQAPFQADAQIVFLEQTSQTTLSVSLDSDLLVLGARAIVRAVDRQGLAELGFIEKPDWLLDDEITRHPARDIFRAVDPLPFRALCAVVLGADTLPAGVSSIGPAKLSRMLENGRSEARLLSELRSQVESADLDAVQVAADALRFEPVFSLAGELVHLPGSGTSAGPLHYFLRQFDVAPRRRVSARGLPGARGVWECAQGGHEALPSTRALKCSFCGKIFCLYCAGARSAAVQSPWRCLWCSSSAAETGAALPQSRATGFLNPRLAAFFDVVATDDVADASIDPLLISTATDDQLVRFARAFGIATKMKRDDIILFAQSLAAGRIPGFVRDDTGGEKEKAGARQAVERGDLKKEEVPWAFDWPVPPPDAVLFDEEFLVDHVTMEDLRFLVRLGANICKRAPADTARNPDGLSGEYVLRSAELARPVGGIERIVRLGVRGAAAEWTPPLTGARASFAKDPRNGEKVLVLSADVHATFTKKFYSTIVFLGERGLAHSQCSCVVGRAICHHAFVLLAQMETALLLPSGGLREALLYSFSERGGTEREVEMEWDSLRVLLGGRCRESLLPGTERRTARWRPPAAMEIEALPASRVVFRSPAAIERRKRRGDGAERPSDLQDYNPFPQFFDSSVMDYVRLRDSWASRPLSEQFKKSVAYRLVHLRAVGADLSVPTSEASADGTNSGGSDSRQMTADAGVDDTASTRTSAAATAAAGGGGGGGGEAAAAGAASAGASAGASAVVRGSRRGISTTGTRLRKRALSSTETVTATPGASAASEAAGASGTTRRRTTRSCNFVNCDCLDSTCKSSSRGLWKRAPRASQAKNETLRKAKNDRRRQWLKAAGTAECDARSDFRICPCHPMGDDGLPLPIGVKNAADSRRPCRGNAADRAAEAYQREISKNHLALAFWEVVCHDEDDAQAASAATDHSLPSASPLRYAHIAQNPRRLRRYTRFECGADFQAYLDVLCNADRSVLNSLLPYYAFQRKRNSRRGGETVDGDPDVDDSFPREKRGRTGLARPCDLAVEDEFLLYLMHEYWREGGFQSLADEFGVSRRTATEIVIKWSVIVRRRAEAFGLYPTWQEYQLLCPAEWKSRYPGLRCHLWDTTDIPLRGKPSEATMQWRTWSEYYANNVYKAGVGCLPFGWLIAASLWTGHISDSDYMVREGILQQQQQLAEVDGGPPVTNICDRGFRCIDQAFAHGEQTLVTPVFRRNGKRFTPTEVAMTTLVARDRARSERMVLRPCLFGFVQRGIPLKERQDVIDLLWLNICFRTNFLFAPLSALVLDEWGALTGNES